jgi:hypothetical protein
VSIRDATTRIEAQLVETIAKLDAHMAASASNVELLHQLKQRLDAHIALNIDGPPPSATP